MVRRRRFRPPLHLGRPRSRRQIKGHSPRHLRTLQSTLRPQGKAARRPVRGQVPEGRQLRWRLYQAPRGWQSRQQGVQ